MGLGYDIVREWAVNNKVEVCEIAQRFGGGFVCSLAQAFARADRLNINKILDNWEHEFKKLYKYAAVERDRMEKAQADSQEELKNTCEEAPHPKCNGAEGCDKCEDNPNNE